MQEAGYGNQHRMENAGYNLTKIRCILSRKGKTENYFVQFMQRTWISWYRSQKVRFTVLDTGTRYMVQDAYF